MGDNMVYLDYSATTPVAKEVLESFNKVCNDYIGNPNSLHRLGLNSKELMYEAILQIASLLNVKQQELIFTSGSSEANNLAIKGICEKYQNRGKHIITTELEHASVSEVFTYLKSKGFKVSYVKVLTDGTVDINHLKSILQDDTILVSIGYVNSELGILQPISDIGKLLKAYPKIFYHVDGTQAVGKIKVDLTDIDLFSFSAHKFYGLKGIGCLYKKDTIDIENIIHGGKSQTKYRGGTPALPLIVSMAKALRLALEDLDEKYKHILDLNIYLKNNLKNMEGVIINSNDKSIPHILNISIPGIKPSTMMNALSRHDIYISTQTACSLADSPSTTLSALYHDNERALSSLRISISHKTTKEEIDLFLKYFKEEYDKLKFMKEK